MRRCSTLLLLFFTLHHVHGDDSVNGFITDIILSLRLISPTIIYHGDTPEICMSRQWMLCLDEGNDQKKLAEHIAMLHRRTEHWTYNQTEQDKPTGRKQDGLLFFGSETDTGLLQNLALLEPLMFRSSCPIVMPLQFSNAIELKLDLNIIFYERKDSTYNLIDKFAVNGGPPIVLQLGTWDEHSGLHMTKLMTRWDRRTDLMGTTFINSLECTLCDFGDKGLAGFKYDENGTIIGSNGKLQEMLFYMTDRINVTIVTKDAYKEEINGTNGCLNLLKLNLTDVCSGGWPIIGRQGESIPIHRQAQTLLGGVHTGNAPDAWVYLEVFGFPQLIGFFSILLITSLVMRMTITLSRDTTIESHGLPNIYLFAIQDGSHVVSKHKAPRIVSLTAGMVTLLMFIYFANDITSKMTAGPPRHPIRTFDDVLTHGYRVILIGEHHLKLLKYSPSTSGKHMVFKKFFEEDDPLDNKTNENYRPWWSKDGMHGIDWAKEEMVADPKTLFYCADSCVKYKNHKNVTIVTLRMDDSIYTLGGYWMQRESEYLDMFNYYLLKEIEHGIRNRVWQTNPVAKIGINEPQSLGFNNVMFLFALLGVAIIISVTMVAIEMIHAEIQRR